MAQAFEDTAPTAAEVTSYDRDHTMLYICLLDREAKGQDWCKTVGAFFGIDPDKEPTRARSVYDSHLNRANALTNIPQFALMQRMASYL